MFYGVNERINLNEALIFSHLYYKEDPAFFHCKNNFFVIFVTIKSSFAFTESKIVFTYIWKPINNETETLDDAL